MKRIAIAISSALLLALGAPATAEVIQRGEVRVNVDAAITPHSLPRHGTAPIHFSLKTKIVSTDGSVPPQLRKISVEINRNGHLDPSGLPTCGFREVQPSTSAAALAACRRSLIGEGRFSARVLIPRQAPFPSNGKILAFNGRWHGHPAVLLHVFGSQPVPTSYTLPFAIGEAHRGAYGTVLTASLPHFTSKWGYVTGISLNLGRKDYLTAGCPAPPGFRIATFSLSRATLDFSGRRPITQTLVRTCTVH
jgi:hypothetical protein